MIDRIGAYSIVRELGRGGMGVVVEARAPDGARVAVKVLRRAPSGESVARFAREERLQAELGEAEGFVPLVDAGDCELGPFIVMPLVEGGSLRERLERGPLELDRASALARDLAATLARAHAKGIVHRDLKPENVLFAEDGRPLVADLGLAKHYRDDVGGASRSVSLSRTGEMRGTFGYMAPEQMRDAKSAGPASDVFALGAIVYECVTGTAPFAGANAIDILARMEKGHEPLARAVPACPPWLARAVDRALAREPEARFADAGAFLAALSPGAKTGRRALVAVPFVGAVAAAIAISGWKKEPPPTAPPVTPAAPPVAPPAPAPALPEKPPFPRLCSGFLESERFKLAAVLGSYRWRHAFPVLAVAVSPDGKRALAAGSEWEPKLWDLATGDELAALPAHHATVTAVAFSPDGRLALTGTRDGVVRTLELAHLEKKAARLAPAGAAVIAVAFGPRGGAALAARADGAIVVAKPDGTPVHRLDPIAPAQAASFSPDGQSVAWIAADGALHLRSIETGTDLVPAAAGPYTSVAFAPDGQRVALGKKGEPTVTVFDLRTSEAAITYAAAPFICAAWSPNGERLAIGCEGAVSIRKGLDNQVAPEHEPLALAFSPDGAKLVVGSGTRAIRVLDAATARDLSRDEDSGPSFSVSEAGGVAFVTKGDGSLRSLDPRTQRSTVLARLPDVGFVAASRDGSRLLFGGHDQLVRVLDASGKELRQVSQGGRVSAVAISADGKRGAAASEDGVVRIFDLDEGKNAATFIERGRYDRVAISSDGARVVGCGRDGAVCRWTAANGAQRNVIPDDPRPAATAVALTTDGRRAVFGHADGTVRLWNLDTMKELPLPSKRHHKLAVVSIAWSPDEKTFATTSYDRSIKLWDPAVAEPLDTIVLHTACDFGWSATFARDGRLLVGTGRGPVLVFEPR